MSKHKIPEFKSYGLGMEGKNRAERRSRLKQYTKSLGRVNATLFGGLKAIVGKHIDIGSAAEVARVQSFRLARFKKQPDGVNRNHLCYMKRVYSYETRPSGIVLRIDGSGRWERK